MVWEEVHENGARWTRQKNHAHDADGWETKPNDTVTSFLNNSEALQFQGPIFIYLFIKFNQDAGVEITNLLETFNHAGYIKNIGLYIDLWEEFLCHK